jgi:hypothetical protein
MQVWNISAAFTRPNNTTAYSSGNLVANSVTAGSVVPMQLALGNGFPQGMTRIVRARLSKSGTSPTNASFRIHLYETNPTPANGDGAAWSTDQAAHWLGNIDVTSMLAFTDGCMGTGSATAGSEMFLRLASGKIVYALLEARAAYTPAANEVFTLTLEDVSDY